MNKPKECPFCGSRRVYYEVDEFDNGYIACRDCRAQGPMVEAKRGANMKAASLWRKAVKR